jgi:hypothetical protein
MATNVTAISQFVRGLTKARPLGVISVAEFGAIGSGTANERTQIQNAIDAANAQGGGVVYFPPGRYRIDSSLTLQQGVWLVGASRRSTSSSIFTAQPITMLNGKLSTFSEFEIGISHLFVDGGGVAISGVDMDKTAAVYIGDCTFTAFNGAGVTFLDCQWSTIERCRFTNSIAGAQLHEILLPSPPNPPNTTDKPNGNLFRECRFEGNSLRGIEALGLNNVPTSTGIELLTVDSCYFVNNGTVGNGNSAAIWAGYIRSLNVTNCWFEKTGGWASIRLLDRTIAPRIERNIFVETVGMLGGGMIYADAGTQVPVITENHFEGDETRYVIVLPPGSKEPALAYIARNSFAATNPILTDDSHVAPAGTSPNPPSVTGADYLALNYGPGTTVTNLNNGSPGQRITLLFLNNNNVTIQNGAAMKLAGGNNFVGNTNDTLTLLRYGNAWYEVARSNN